jgi:hypothetical protein
MEPIKFGADKVKVNGPLVGGEYSVTFYTGEYEQLNVAKMLAIPQETPLKVTVSIYDKQG